MKILFISMIYFFLNYIFDLFCILSSSQNKWYLKSSQVIRSYRKQNMVKYRFFNPYVFSSTSYLIFIHFPLV